MPQSLCADRASAAESATHRSLPANQQQDNRDEIALPAASTSWVATKGGDGHDSNPNAERTRTAMRTRPMEGPTTIAARKSRPARDVSDRKLLFGTTPALLGGFRRRHRWLSRILSLSGR